MYQMATKFDSQMFSLAEVQTTFPAWQDAISYWKAEHYIWIYRRENGTEAMACLPSHEVQMEGGK